LSIEISRTLGIHRVAVILVDVSPHVELCLPGRDNLLVGWVGELELGGLCVTQIPDLAREVLELLSDWYQITTCGLWIMVRDSNI
jgi:hypothetical protein